MLFDQEIVDNLNSILEGSVGLFTGTTRAVFDSIQLKPLQKEEPQQQQQSKLEFKRQTQYDVCIQSKTPESRVIYCNREFIDE